MTISHAAWRLRSRLKQALDNIQRMLSQLMKNRNNEDDFDNRDRKEENRKDEVEEHSKESSSINVEVIKGIQAQRDKLKKARMTHPYPLEGDSIPYAPKFKPPTLHSYDSKSSPNQHIYLFDLKPVM